MAKDKGMRYSPKTYFTDRSADPPRSVVSSSKPSFCPHSKFRRNTRAASSAREDCPIRARLENALFHLSTQKLVLHWRFPSRVFDLLLQLHLLTARHCEYLISSRRLESERAFLFKPLYSFSPQIKKEVLYIVHKPCKLISYGGKTDAFRT